VHLRIELFGNLPEIMADSVGSKLAIEQLPTGKDEGKTFRCHFQADVTVHNLSSNDNHKSLGLLNCF
jgi:hypothetical protein